MLTTLFAVFAWGCSGGGSTEAGDEAGSGSPREAEAAAAPTGADAQPRPTASEWLLVDDSDAGAGAADVELAREASRGVNSTGISPTLHLRCVDGESEVIIVWYEDPEGSDNDVTTQIGDADPVRRTWTNQNEDATVFPSDSAAIFIQRLTEADSLTASTNLYKRMPVTAVFDLTGLSESLGPLQEACDL
ncbi:MAG: type VI secretion system-associated protein TagO [Longimicrobiales bacterium]|nr:type VI secretion system-associated protein TagO [Longimicrobiales bacterium]